MNAKLPYIWLPQITKDELAKLLNLSDADASKMLAGIDENGDGSLSIQGNSFNIYNKDLDEWMNEWIVIQLFMQYGLKQPKIQTKVMGHSLVCLHCSLVHLLHPAFTVGCACLFTRITRSCGKVMIGQQALLNHSPMVSLDDQIFFLFFPFRNHEEFRSKEMTFHPHFKLSVLVSWGTYYFCTLYWSTFSVQNCICSCLKWQLIWQHLSLIWLCAKRQQTMWSSVLIANLPNSDLIPARACVYVCVRDRVCVCVS